MTSHHKTNSPMLIAFYISIAVIALGVGLFYAPKGNNLKPPALESATLLLPPKLISEPGLVDHNDKPFNLASLKGHWSFFFFGYTNCPDVCPATLYQFKILAKLLEPYPQLKSNTRFILVSIDPERDAAKHLKEYVQYYHPDFIGVTGEQKKVYTFSRQMGVIYERRDIEGSNNQNKDYLMDHSSAILLLNPEAQIQGIFSAPHKAETLLKNYMAIRTYLEGLKK